MLVIAKFKNGERCEFQGVRLMEHAEIEIKGAKHEAIRLRYYKGGDTFLPFSCFLMAVPGKEDI